MKINLLISLLSVVFLSDDAFGQTEIKRGTFPFMAFIYYSDDTVVDLTGRRFFRGAVLIRRDWLVTSAFQISDGDADAGFPRKTLLARVGATSISSNFQLNEDEDEQEIEIVQIVRPYNHSATQWWRTDISLMKTLNPFNLTSAVTLATLDTKGDTTGKMCSILAYTLSTTKKWTQSRNLIQLPVELLPPSMMNCGTHFYESTMVCGVDAEGSQSAYFDSFCQGNNGGPLICDGKVIALQTYIDNDCRAPHLYQLLSAWDKFIACSTEDKCEKEQCANICLITNKDPLTTEPQRINKTIDIDTSRGKEDVDITMRAITSITLGTETASTLTESSVKPTTIPTTQAATTSSAMEKTTVDIPKTTMETTRTKNMQTMTPSTTPTTITKMTTTIPKATIPAEEIPYDKYDEELETQSKLDKKYKSDERKANIEAQHHVVEKKKASRSAAERNMVFRSLFNVLIFASFI